MPAATRLGDICTGHGCFGPRVCDSASTNVFINGKGVHRVGDHWVTHCCGPSCHDSVCVSGSSTVFINGVPAARIGDAIGCGSVIAQGSSDTFIG
jgi:uncharacterized Zn-binding protein involved in type VI secretion